MDIKITKAAVLKEKPDPSTLGFGKIFTDHMFVMDFSREQGWHDARIVPLWLPFDTSRFHRASLRFGNF